MKEFRVRWEIDVIASDPVEAAMKAYAIQRKPESTATHFTVIPTVGEDISVDVDVEEVLEKFWREFNMDGERI